MTKKQRNSRPRSQDRLPLSKGPESWEGMVLILPLIFYSFQVIPGVGGSGGLAAQGDMVCCLTLFGVSRQPSNLCQQLEVCQAKVRSRRRGKAARGLAGA